MKYTAYLLSLLLLASCGSKTISNKKEGEGLLPDTVVKSQPAGEKDSMQVAVKTLKENDNWGYEIFVNEKLYIHQPQIPAVSGNKNFVSEEDATKVGEFVAYKIRMHISPPSVTPQELDSLGIKIR